MNITIHKVKTLILTTPRPRRHGVRLSVDRSDSARRQGMAAHLPAAIQVTCKGMGLSWPGGATEPLEASAPPMQQLRAALNKACPTCGGRQQISYNPTGEVGAQEYAPCPSCSRKRRDSDG